MMSTASGPLSTLPWPSATLPITITFPGTVFPTTSTTMSASDPAVITSGTSMFPSSTTSFTTTESGGQSSSTDTTSAISTPSETRSTQTISASSSPSTRLSSASSTLQSASLTRTASSLTTVTPSASTTLIRGTLAPSDDSDGGGPTVAAAQQEISRLKETRTIVIAVLSALALVAVLVAARAVYLRRRGYSNTHRDPTPLPQHKSPSGPLLTADTPLGGTTHGAPWPFLAVPEWHPNRLAPPPPRPPPQQPEPYRNMHMQHPQRASILPQTLDAWIAGAGSSSVDLRSVSQPATPSPHVRHEYRHGYI